jgi:hypothetical protein
MSKQSNAERKSGLIAGLKDVRKRILTLASKLDPGKHEEVYLGTWSVREMLAHLAGWDETNIRAADEILCDDLPSFYKYSDKDWASYNVKLVSEYSRENFEDLISLVGKTHTALVDKVEKISADELWRDRGIRARGWKVTIGRLLEVELEDEEEHYSQLRAFIEEGDKT